DRAHALEDARGAAAVLGRAGLERLPEALAPRVAQDLGEDVARGLLEDGVGRGRRLAPLAEGPDEARRDGPVAVGDPPEAGAARGPGERLEDVDVGLELERVGEAADVEPHEPRPELGRAALRELEEDVGGAPAVDGLLGREREREVLAEAPRQDLAA